MGLFRRHLWSGVIAAVVSSGCGYSDVLTAQSTRVAIDATNKPCAVRLLNSTYPWINDANAVWSGVTVPRWNKSYVQWPANWTRTAVVFEAQCTPVTNSDMKFAVEVDGLIQAVIAGRGTTVGRYYVDGLKIAPGGSTVRVWEPWTGRTSGLASGVDAPVEGGIITAVYLPAGVSLPAKPTSTTAYVLVGDSIIHDCADREPETWNSLGGLIRRNAFSLGRLVVSLDYGSCTLATDGPTAAQLATLIQDAAATTGATTVYVFFQIGSNDWAYSGSTASNVGTFLQNVVNALPSAYKNVISTPIPRVNETNANSQGNTLAQYRTAEAAVTGTNVTILDGTSYGFTSAALPDGVHEGVSAAALNYAGVKTALGLP